MSKTVVGGLLLIGVSVPFGGSYLATQDPLESNRAYHLPKGPWPEEDRRGAAAIASVHLVHRMDFSSLQLLAEGIVRGTEGSLSSLEERALLALGLDVDKMFPDPDSVEIELWRIVAQGGMLPMPVDVGVFGRPQGRESYVRDSIEVSNSENF